LDVGGNVNFTAAVLEDKKDGDKKVGD